jgi:hypothetical protein
MYPQGPAVHIQPPMYTHGPPLHIQPLMYPHGPYVQFQHSIYQPRPVHPQTGSTLRFVQPHYDNTVQYTVSQSGLQNVTHSDTLPAVLTVLLSVHGRFSARSIGDD